MELLQLRYFRALAENGNLTKTAKQLYISPSSLSLTISRLEKELGDTLFDRVGNHIQLNSRGFIFLNCVNLILTNLDRTIKELTDMTNAQQSLLSIATTSPNVWFKLFSKFSSVHPEFLISHTLLRLNQISAADLQTKYDFLITSPSDITDPGLQSTILYADDYPILMVHPEHRLAKRRQISLAEAKDEPFIALTLGFSSRKYFDDLCEMAGFSPRIVMECDYMMRTYMVKQKTGVAVATARVKKERQNKGIKMIDIVDPVFPRAQAIFWNPKRRQTEAASVFSKFATQLFANSPQKRA